MALRIFPRTSVTLPTGGAVLREPYSRGLVAAFAPGVPGCGTTDLVSGLSLTRSGAVLSTGGGTSGLVCATAGAHAKILCPDWLKIPNTTGPPPAITLIARMSFLGTPSVAANLFGVSANNTGASPYVAYSFDIDAAGYLRLSCSTGGSYAAFNGGPGLGYERQPVVGFPFTMVGLFTNAEVTIYFGPDEGVVYGFGVIPTYSATSELAIGDSFGGRNPNVCLEYGLIYNRRLVTAEYKKFREDPYHWLRIAAAHQFAIGAAAATTAHRVTQIVREVAYSEDAAAPAPAAPCVGDGTVASGDNPDAGYDELEAPPTPAPLAWLELTVGVTVYRWAAITIPHGAIKYGRVLTFGRVRRTLTDDDGGPQTSTVTTRLADTDGALRALQTAGTLKNALVEYFVADLETLRTAGTAYRVFRGRVAGAQEEPDRAFTITVEDELTARLTSTDAADLQTPQTILESSSIVDTNPNERMVGKPAPEWYGSLSDEDAGAAAIGVWQCPYSASITFPTAEELGNNHVFLVGVGVAAQIQSLYAGDAASGDPPTARARVPDADIGGALGPWWVPTMAGWFLADDWYEADLRRWTIIVGLQGHPAVEEARSGRIPLVINFCGYDTVGDATGATINSPARALLHWFNNRIVQDATGDWLAIAPLGDYSLFDTTTFETVHDQCAALGYVIAGVLGADYTQRSWREGVAEFCRNFGFELGINRHGQAILVKLDRTQDYATAPAFTPADILVGGCRVNRRADAVENLVRFVYQRNYCTALQQLNPPEGERAWREPFDQTWLSGQQEVDDSPSIDALGGEPRGIRRSVLQEYGLVRDEDVAFAVAQERLELRRPPNGRAEITFDLGLRDGAGLELGDVLTLEHWDLPWTDARRCQVRALEVDLDQLTITPTVRDVDDLLP